MSLTIPSLSAAWRQAAKCMACGRPPERLTTRTCVDTNDLELVIYCHGSVEVIRVPGRPVDHDAVVGHTVRRLGALFSHDASPDMIELLRYNRNPWKLT